VQACRDSGFAQVFVGAEASATGTHEAAYSRACDDTATTSPAAFRQNVQKVSHAWPQ
jgi:hypothetical protein